MDLKTWTKHVQDLQKKTAVIEKAALWAVQAQFLKDPVFTGPIVAADIMAAGFYEAEKRFQQMVDVMSEGKDTEFDLPDFSWGAAIGTLLNWAKRVKIVNRPKLRTRLESAVDEETSVSSKGSGKSTWYYGVARGKSVGVFDKWFGKAETSVIGFSNPIYKKFWSEKSVSEFV